MADLAIEIRGLTKMFPGDVTAVDTLDMTVPQGAVYGLIGRNGAGKTTTLRLLMGLLRPDHGLADVLGADMRTAAPPHRARVMYVSQSQQLYAWMTLVELGYYLSHFYPRWDASRLRRLAQRFEVPLDRQIGVMSGGEQRKAAIVLALAARTEVLLLDEPAGGLDPIARRQLVDEVVDLATARRDDDPVQYAYYHGSGTRGGVRRHHGPGQAGQPGPAGGPAHQHAPGAGDLRRAGARQAASPCLGRCAATRTARS